MSKALDESCFRHSLSLFTTFGTWTRSRRSPVSENSTISTSSGFCGATLGSVDCDLLIDLQKNSTPAIAAAELRKNLRVTRRDAGSSVRSEPVIVLLQQAFALSLPEMGVRRCRPATEAQRRRKIG